MPKKKLLFIISSLKAGGGAERVTSFLSYELSQNFKIYTLTFFNISDEYFVSDRICLNENRGILNNLFTRVKLNYLVRLIRIFKIIISISPDIIISMKDFANMSVILSKLIFRIKIPLIICIHSNPDLHYKENNKYMKNFIKNFYRLNLITKIITVSSDIGKILSKNYKIPPKKLKTIHNGLDIDKINILKKEKIQDYYRFFNDENIIKFVSMGRIETVKGHRYLINAFFLVKKEMPNVKLFILGEGSQKSSLIRYVKDKYLSDDVLFLGYKKNPFKYLFMSDIFVLSSIYEGLPMAILEAQACGLPIISTNCMTGPREILKNGKYGLLVKVCDTKDLAEKMLLLSGNKTLRLKFSDLSLKRAESFKKSKVINDWISIIESLFNT